MSQALAKGCTRMTPQQPYNVDEVYTHSTDVAAEAQSEVIVLLCPALFFSTALLTLRQILCFIICLSVSTFQDTSFPWQGSCLFCILELGVLRKCLLNE